MPGAAGGHERAAVSDRPYLLLRRDKPQMWFATAAEAQRFYDQLRANNYRQAQGAAVFGPNRSVWYAAPGRHAPWLRDDERRRREAGAAKR